MTQLKRRRTGHKYYKNNFSSNKTYVLPGMENWNKSSATSLTRFRSVLPVRCLAAFWTPSEFVHARYPVYSFALYLGIRRVPISNWPSQIRVTRQQAHSSYLRWLRTPAERWSDRKWFWAGIYLNIHGYAHVVHAKLAIQIII